MAEETTDDVVSADPTEVAEGGVTEAAKVIDVNAKVMVGEREMTVTELVAEAQRAEELTEYKTHASRLLNATDADGLTPEREHSLRHVMMAEGYSPETVEQYVHTLKNPDTGEVEMEQDNTMDTGGDAVPSADSQRIAELESRLAASENRQSDVNVQQMKIQLDSSVQSALDSDDGISSLMKRMVKLNGEDGQDDRLKAIEGDLRRETMNLLKARRAAGDKFEPSWFGIAAGQAAKVVADKYRAVIGNADQLQRVPETAPGEEHLISSEPPKKPVWQPGEDGSDVLHKARTYTEQTLRSLVADSDTGGGSKL